MTLSIPILSAPLLALALGAPAPQPPDYDAATKEARAILAELVAADTSQPQGHEARATAIAARYLDAAGIPYETSEFAPGRRNLVARLKGTGEERPLLLLSHTDVVGTAHQTWTSDPHKLTEANGQLVARGVEDDLGPAAINLETLLLLKRSGARLRRDVIMAWEGDEEADALGIRDLLKNRRSSIDAELAFNEGLGPVLGADGKVRFVSYDLAEKIYQDYELVATGPSGHSSAPLEGNAIYRLAAALDRLGRWKFPVRLLPATRAYFEARAAVEPPALAAAMRALSASKGKLPADSVRTVSANPSLDATLRTTCVATMLQGGTQVNALPVEAKATVNCRILPDESAEDVRAALARVIADPKIEIKLKGDTYTSPASPVDGPGPRAIRKVAGEMWPGRPVIPFLKRGASDSLFLRAAGIPTYGIPPIPMSEPDYEREHGIDERLPVASLRAGVEFNHRLALEIAGR